MQVPIRSDIIAANRRGAFVLGALLTAIVLVAIALSLRISSQLSNAVALESTLIDAQQDLGEVIRAQLELQNSLRGYVTTRDVEFLATYRTSAPAFDESLTKFHDATSGLGIAGLDAEIQEMSGLHASWLEDVADPLLRDPRAKGVLERETLGKIYADRLRGETEHVLVLLKARLGAAELDLRRLIGEAAFAGIASIVVFGFVSIAFVTSRVQMQDVIDRERAIVETLGGAFRTDLDALPGMRVGTAYLSADRDAAVGGDLYDIRRIDDRRGLVLVADVSGKGIQAAVNTAFVKYSIRALARGSDDPAAILAEFNRMFLETVRDPNLFVVGFVGIFDGPGLALTYASAGHGGAYLRRAGGVRQLDVTGPILGLDASFGYEARTLALVPGDALLLATDGLSEARDAAGDLLGDEGTMGLFGSHWNADPQRCADAIVADVRTRGGGTLRDDLALLVIAVDAAA